MPLELLLDLFEPVIELLRLGVQPDEFGHQRRQGFVAQGCRAILGDRCDQALHAAERAIAQHSLILWDQSTTASAGAIKLCCTLWAQASAILCIDSDTHR